MKTIIVTGTPGTGKTLLSRKLASKLNFQYIDVNKMVRKHKISEGYDKKRKAKIIDVNKLSKAMIKEINKIKNANEAKAKKIKAAKVHNKNNSITKKPMRITGNEPKNRKAGIIIDSHLSHYLPKKYADLCIVTKCDLKLLKKRLERRGYSKQKIRENMDAEIFDICLNEARENGHKAIIVDTTVKININKVVKLITSSK